LKNEIKHTEFENQIKQKLDNFEFPFNDAAWNNFKGKLPKKNFFTTKTFFFGLTAIVVSSLLLLYINNNKIANNNTSNNTKIEVTNNNNNIKSNIITETNNNNDEISDAEIITTEIEKNTDKIITSTENNSENTEKTEIINNDQNNEKENNIVKENKNTITNQKTPNTNYKTNIQKGCEPLTVKFTPNEISDSIIYLWNFGDGSFSNDISPSYKYTKSGKYKVVLTVKYYRSSQLSDNADKTIEIYPKPKSKFETDNNNNVYKFINTSKQANKFEWFINNDYFNSKNTSCEFDKDCLCKVKLISYNQYGCSDTLDKNVKIDIECPIHMPTAFTPYEIGENSKFGPITKDFEGKSIYFIVVNDHGKIVFESNDINYHWDGKIKGTSEMAESGKYSWEYIIIDANGNTKSKKGYVYLLK